MLSYFTQKSGQCFIVGLSTDTKPQNPPAGWTFLEQDTSRLFLGIASAWTEIINPSLVTLVNGKVPTIQLGGAGADATKFLRGDQTWAAPSGGGSDPWTYAKVTGADFTTSSATAVDVTGLGFTPALNTNYEFEAILMARTATATVNPRAGLAWPTGMTDGVAMIMQAGVTAVAAFPSAAGNIAASLLIAVGGLLNATQSWPVNIRGMVKAGATPSGSVRVQLASETAGTVVRVVLGSFLRYRAIP